jgi:membrane protein
MSMADAWGVLKRAVSAWIDDRAPSMGAAIAYYTVFSLSPMVILVIAIGGLFFGEEAARGAVVGEFGGLMGQQGAEALQSMVATAGEVGSGFAALIGIVMLVVGATTVFAELQSSLNVIWRAKPPPVSTVMWMLKVRLAGLALIVGIGFLLLVSLVASAALTAFGDWLSSLLPGLDLLLRVVNILVSLGVVTVLFAMIYRFLPDTRIPWADVWVGALVTAGLFTIGKTLIGLYIGSSKVASGFGAAGALVVILVWVYYSAQIFLFGAEITRAWAETRGSRSRSRHARAAAPGGSP